MKGIGFKNMKVFKDKQWFDFKDITLLTGTNNSGKSSIISAMQLLQDNINAKNVDGLIKTEFKLNSALHKKYGSIANFVNNDAKPEDNYFVFIRQIKNVRYHIKVNINPGLEDYGSVKAVMGFDANTNELIFSILVLKQYPDYECGLNINYRYFIDRFNTKCKNTEILWKRKVELDKLCEEVNKGKKTLQELKAFADFVSNEVSVYVHVAEQEWYSVDELRISGKQGKPKKKIAYQISHKVDELGFEETDQFVDEIGALFTKKKPEVDEKGRRWGGGISLINKKEYEELKPSSVKGIFDFSFLWEQDPEIETDLEYLICAYYGKDFKESYKMLCDDLLTLLSGTMWTMKEMYSDMDESFVPQNLTETYINSLPYLGLIDMLIKRKNGYSVSNDFVKINGTFMDQLNISNKLSNSEWGRAVMERIEAIKELRTNDFFEKIISFLTRLFSENYISNNNSINYERLIAEPVFDIIHTDIIQKIFSIDLSLDNVNFVSSNRFAIKRAYSFNDNTDFTNLLKQIVDAKSGEYEERMNFINKWIKEFNIADELLLKADRDTGNFKAFLRMKDKEVLLSDFGLGTNQLLPVIFSMAIRNYEYKDVYTGLQLSPRILVIEEPEANLHPALQSKLADLFVEATNKFKVQIIVETHSEYLIRRMQYLVAKDYALKEDGDSTIGNNKVNIYYVNSEVDELGRKAYEINITKNGQLTENFGKGFIDETTRLQFELYKLNNAQSN